MAALKTAAKSLIDQLSALAKNPGDVYVSIIPFAKDVNVGASNYNANWIDWTDWDATTEPDVCNGNWRNQTWTPKNHNTWNGCVTDRDSELRHAEHRADRRRPSDAVSGASNTKRVIPRCS